VIRRKGRRGDLAPAPFVVGVGRSGTTLLRLMLDAHPQLAIGPETHFLPRLIELEEGSATPEELVGAITDSRHWGDFALDAAELRARVAAQDATRAAEVARAFYELYARSRDKPRWGDKTPGYVKRMRPIAAQLEEARFVHLIRDGRDVALSRRRRGMGAEKSLGEVAELWRRRIENARRQARRLRGRYLELRYEDLVAEPEPHLRQVSDLIELEFDPAMLAHHERASERLDELGGDLPAQGARAARAGEERLRAHALAAEPATGARTEAWREQMSSADRAEFEAVAGPLLAELGYDLPS
jgi:hypothetical protein